MSTLLLSCVLALTSVAGQAAQAPLATAASVVVTPSAPVVEVDMRRLKGPLVRQLAWSPDQTELYLQTYEANRDASVRNTFHYVIPVVGGAPQQVDIPPSRHPQVSTDFSRLVQEDCHVSEYPKGIGIKGLSLT